MWWLAYDGDEAKLDGGSGGEEKRSAEVLDNQRFSFRCNKTKENKKENLIKETFKWDSITNGEWTNNHVWDEIH